MVKAETNEATTVMTRGSLQSSQKDASGTGSLGGVDFAAGGGIAMELGVPLVFGGIVSE